MKIVKDKSVLVGDEKLIPMDSWIPIEEMNTDIKILEHHIFNDAFEKILKLHKMKHNVAFISLCTSTRPYQNGKKWTAFVNEFANKADLIVTSSGGIIPQSFWGSFPYLNYDGDSHPDSDPLYKQILKDRLIKFFTKFQYEYIVANFRPSLRNTPVVKEVLMDLKKKKIITDYKVIPDEPLYNKAKDDGFRGKNGGGAMFPDLHKFVFDELKDTVSTFSNTKNENILF